MAADINFALGTAISSHYFHFWEALEVLTQLREIKGLAQGDTHTVSDKPRQGTWIFIFTSITPLEKWVFILCPCPGSCPALQEGVNSLLDALNRKGWNPSTHFTCTQVSSLSWVWQMEESPEGDDSMAREFLIAPWEPPWISGGTGDGGLRPHAQLSSVEQIN